MPLVSRARRTAEFLFPERQVLLRTDGEIRFVTLRRPLQMGLSAVCLALLAWTVYATVGLGVSEQSVAKRDASLAAMGKAYDRLSADLRSVHERYEAITRALEDKHLFLSDVLKERAGLERRLRVLSGELSRTANERDRAEAAGDNLRSTVSNLGDQLDMALATADRLERNLEQMSDELTQSADARAGSARENAELNRAIDNMRAQIVRAETRETGLAQSLRESDRTAEAMRLERDRERARSARLDKRVRELETHMAFLESSQGSLIARLNEQTETNISSLEAAVRLTGLDVNRLIQRVGGPDAVGGPLIEFSGVDADGAALDLPQNAADSTLTALEGRLERWSALNVVLELLPISAPLDQYRISSRFGVRRDPFTKRRAMHAGLDMAGPLRSPVFATAPGEVIYVGWKGPYGRTVIIDHGHGLQTKYGHLRKILVKKGKQVAFREKIGLMGNSGRSTGSHLHYEIVFDGKPVDPAQFLKAGQYVFKQG